MEYLVTDSHMFNLYQDIDEKSFPKYNSKITLI